jgi:hypothetical protein
MENKNRNVPIVRGQSLSSVPFNSNRNGDGSNDDAEDGD